MDKRGTALSVLVGWVYYILIFAILAYFTGAPFERIFLGTIALFLYISIFHVLSFHNKTDAFHVWIAPLVFPLIFLGVWYSGSVEFLNVLDGIQLTVFCILLSYLLNFLYLTAHPPKKKTPYEHQRKHPPHTHYQRHHPPSRHHAPRRQVHRNVQHHKQPQKPQQTVPAHHHHAMKEHHLRQQQHYVSEINRLRKQVGDLQEKNQITMENLQLNLKSIEDKCKAINFVIGRVYSDKKGGNAELREKLNISRDLYNAFSEMAANFHAKHMGQLLQVLGEIYKKLVQMEMPENKIITLQKDPHLPLERNPNGTDKIIDVLARNDKDPIIEYQSEAKEICTRLSEFIRRNYR